MNYQQNRLNPWLRIVHRLDFFRKTDMRHSNSKYLIVFGLIAALSSGCAVRDKSRVAGNGLFSNVGLRQPNWLKKQQSISSNQDSIAAAEECDCATGLPGLVTANRVEPEMPEQIQLGSEAIVPATTEQVLPTLILDVVGEFKETSILKNPNPTFEESGEIPESGFSTVESSRTYYHGKDRDSTLPGNPDSQIETVSNARSENVMLSDQHYPTSIAGELTSSEFDLAPHSWPSAATVAGQSSGQANEQSFGPLDQELNQPLLLDDSSSVVAEATKAVQNSGEGRLNKRKVANQEVQPMGLIAPRDAKTVQLSIDPDDIPLGSVTRPPANIATSPVLLHADTAARPDFPDAITRRCQERELKQRMNPQAMQANSLAIEPVNFYPLPSLRSTVDQRRSTDQTTKRDSSTRGILTSGKITDRSKSESSTDTGRAESPASVPLVPLKKPTAGGLSSFARLPSSTDQPLIMRASASKWSWDAAPKMDAVARARLSQPTGQVQANHLFGSQALASSSTATPSTSGSGWQGTSGWAHPHQSNSDSIRLRATVNQPHEWTPPTVSISAAVPAESNSRYDQIQFDNDRRLEMLQQQLQNGTLPSYNYSPAMDIEVSDAIKHLTIRPSENDGSPKTIDR